MTTDTRIGECDACHARFKVPASFRADRARCRECGGVVILERTQPVPRPPLEKSRKSKTAVRPNVRTDSGLEERSAPTTSARPEAREPQRASERATERDSAAAKLGAPVASNRPAVAKPAVEKERSPPAKGSKKSPGVLGSIVAAAKAAMWRKKRGDAGSSD